MSIKYAIGIDPGSVKTGVAIWDLQTRQFAEIRTFSLPTAAEDLVRQYIDKGEGVFLFIEDARQRKNFGKTGPERRIGAGYAKSESKRWEGFAKYCKVPCLLGPPKNTKMKAGLFKVATGFNERTSEHARDAAMIVYNLSENQVELIIQSNQQGNAGFKDSKSIKRQQNFAN